MADVSAVVEALLCKVAILNISAVAVPVAVTLASNVTRPCCITSIALVAVALALTFVVNVLVNKASAIDIPWAFILDATY